MDVVRQEGTELEERRRRRWWPDGVKTLEERQGCAAAGEAKVRRGSKNTVRRNGGRPEMLERMAALG
jgi:hypothetical protein